MCFKSLFCLIFEVHYYDTEIILAKEVQKLSQSPLQYVGIGITR